MTSQENIIVIARDGITEELPSEANQVKLRNKKGMVILLGLYYRTLKSQEELEEQI